jgi:hypothetical protein
MTTALDTTVEYHPRAPMITLGRTFVHPLFDLFVIGGLLTVPIALLTTFVAGPTGAVIALAAPVVFLLCNNAHFAASTFRLYTKPRSFTDFPFLTMGFPLVTLAVVAVFVAFAGRIGPHLQALYLTWSPYHYAAQTFGLATMYSYRSGCRLDRREWWVLRVVCLLPFLQTLLGGAPYGQGLGWLVPYGTLIASESRFHAMQSAVTSLNCLSFGAPLALFGWIAYRSRAATYAGERSGLPLIAVALMLSNAAWWILFPYWDAMVWGTVLHGVQYLGIVAIFHAEDQVRRPDNRHGRGYHALVLLLACVALGYGLFQCWPRAYMLAGYGKVESMFMVMAAINIHHFIVDAYIWRIRKDPNYRTVVA